MFEIQRVRQVCSNNLDMKVRSMTMPFDSLRSAAPLGPGVFMANNGALRVELCDINKQRALVKIGSEARGDFRVAHRSAVVLAAFFAELAKQLEPASNE